MQHQQQMQQQDHEIFQDPSERASYQSGMVSRLFDHFRKSRGDLWAIKSTGSTVGNSSRITTFLKTSHWCLSIIDSVGSETVFGKREIAWMKNDFEP